MQLSGSAIERVFTQPVVPARRFRGAIDTAFTLALGSVCAFALTLGPAPLNTVAASSPAAASLAGHFDPVPEFSLLPAEVGQDEPEEESSESPTPSATDKPDPQGSPNAPPGPPGAATKPGAAKKAEPPTTLTDKAEKTVQVPVPSVPRVKVPEAATPLPEATASAALTVVEMFRMAYGLSAFVSAAECSGSTVYASVTVIDGVLPLGQAMSSLAPDPAYATGGEGLDDPSVTVYACR